MSQLPTENANPKWTEENGVIYFEVASDGATGKEWIDRFENLGVKLSIRATGFLHSPEFVPTSGVTYRIAVLQGSLFTDNDRKTWKIRAEAIRRGFMTPHREIACLIREKFSYADLTQMGLHWLVTMHSGPFLLYAERCDDDSWLDGDKDGPDDMWHCAYGFAFVVPQVDP